MSDSRHPRHELDELVHTPVRLSVTAVLDAVEETDFQFLRDAVEVSDSLLSKHVSRLEDAGYVHVTKGVAHGRPRTVYTLTTVGRAAFLRYRMTLARIMGDGGPLGRATPDQDSGVGSAGVPGSPR